MVIGSPKIELPIRVFQPTGIEMRIATSSAQTRESATQLKTWVTEGDEILVALQVYSFDSNKL